MTHADQQALTVIGINLPAEVRAIQTTTNPEVARKRLDDLKAKARKAYRKAARTFHPDTNGGDAGKTRIFVALTKAVEALCELRVNPPQKAPIYVTVTYCSTDSTTTNAYATAWRVVNMRPF